jgi:hypothetical protein
MRSTLLFVAVLLACSPMHAQATAPEGAQVSITWLDALFPATVAETTLRPAVQRRTLRSQAFPRQVDQPRAQAGMLVPPPRAASLLLYYSNAP